MNSDGNAGFKGFQLELQESTDDGYSVTCATAIRDSGRRSSQMTDATATRPGPTSRNVLVKFHLKHGVKHFLLSSAWCRVAQSSQRYSNNRIVNKHHRRRGWPDDPIRTLRRQPLRPQHISIQTERTASMAETQDQQSPDDPLPSSALMRDFDDATSASASASALLAVPNARAPPNPAPPPNRLHENRPLGARPPNATHAHDPAVLPARSGIPGAGGRAPPARPLRRPPDRPLRPRLGRPLRRPQEPRVAHKQRLWPRRAREYRLRRDVLDKRKRVWRGRRALPPLYRHCVSVPLRRRVRCLRGAQPAGRRRAGNQLPASCNRGARVPRRQLHLRRGHPRGRGARCRRGMRRGAQDWQRNGVRSVHAQRNIKHCIRLALSPGL